MIKSKTEKMYEIQVVINPDEKKPKYGRVCSRTNVKSARKYISSMVGKSDRDLTGTTAFIWPKNTNFTFKREHFRIVCTVTTTTKEIEVVE